MKDEDAPNILRDVPLEEIATFLHCDPSRLATALRKLVETPSAVKYGEGLSGESLHACISPPRVRYSLTPKGEADLASTEIRVLEELLKKPDGRAE